MSRKLTFRRWATSLRNRLTDRKSLEQSFLDAFLPASSAREQSKLRPGNGVNLTPTSVVNGPRVQRRSKGKSPQFAGPLRESRQKRHGVSRALEPRRD